MSADNYPYHRPQGGLSGTLAGLNLALASYYGDHPPCPAELQTAMLLTPAAMSGGEREEAFNQLALLTGLAYQFGASPEPGERLALCLQVARRTLLLGDVLLAGVDYNQDRIGQQDAGAG